jgi:hypothetical protein
MIVNRGGLQMMRAMRVAAAMMIADIGPSIGQEILDGTWKLVTSNRTTTATGASIDTFSPDPKGYIMYGKDGRVMVLQTRGDRPRPESVEGLTDDQRIKLFSSILAYAGTYKFDGTTIEHHIDLSWNELWNGDADPEHKKRWRPSGLDDPAFAFSDRWVHGLRSSGVGEIQVSAKRRKQPVEGFFFEDRRPSVFFTGISSLFAFSIMERKSCHHRCGVAPTQSSARQSYHSSLASGFG